MAATRPRRISIERMAAQLKKWLPLMVRYATAWSNVRSESADRTRFGVLVTIEVEMELRDNDDGQRYRDLVSMLRLLSVIHPKLFICLLDSYQDMYGDVCDEPRVAIERGVPIDMCIHFKLPCDEVHRLTPNVAHSLLSERIFAMDENGVGSAYAQLLKRVDAAKNRHVLQFPVQVTMQIVSDDISNRKLTNAEEYLLGLAKFAASVCAIRGEPEAIESVFDATKLAHFPVEMGVLTMCLPRCEITSAVADAAQALMASGLRIDVTRLHLDPTLIKSSPDTITALVRILCEVSSGTSIVLGTRSSDTEDVAEDEDADDQLQIVETIKLVIEATPTVRSVDICGLLTMEDATYRPYIFSELIPSILSRPTPIEKFSSGFRGVLTAEDVDLIQEGNDQWRLNNPTRKLRAKAVSLMIGELDNDAVHALMTIIDDAEEVSLSHPLPTPRMDTATARVILRYPSLHSLALDSVTIDTMDIFDPQVPDPSIPSKPSLSQLALSDIALNDVPSMARFVAQLKDESHPLASTLRLLKVSECHYSIDAWKLDEPSIVQLLRVLARNHSLRYVKVSVATKLYSDGEVNGMYHSHLLRHSHQFQGRRISTPRNEWKDIEFAQRTAFLSVLQSQAASVPSACQALDSVTLGNIFSFCAPSVGRLLEVLGPDVGYAYSCYDSDDFLRICWWSDDGTSDDEE